LYHKSPAREKRDFVEHPAVMKLTSSARGCTIASTYFAFMNMPAEYCWEVNEMKNEDYEMSIALLPARALESRIPERGRE
jgi:hypothetical protein